eukprot:CFRG6843T1
MLILKPLRAFSTPYVRSYVHVNVKSTYSRTLPLCATPVCSDHYQRWGAFAATCLCVAAVLPFVTTVAQAEEEDSATPEDGNNKNEAENAEKKRNRKTIKNYEDRLRRFSPAEKLFRYFATVSCQGTVFMTSDDFLRSVCDGADIQQEGLRLDQHRKLTPRHFDSEFLPRESTNLTTEVNTVLEGHRGVIDYAEYILLRSLLATPQKYFNIAFRMIDADNSELMDIDEFLSVLSQLFGTDGKKQISFPEFEKFVLKLKSEVVRKQFDIATDVGEDMMSQRQFGICMVNQITNKTLQKKLRSSAKMLSKEPSIDFRSFCKFLLFLEKIDEVGMALSFGNSGTAGVSQETFKRAFKVIVDAEPDEEIVESIYKLFDINGDGYLSRKEFYLAMRDQNKTVDESTKSLGFTDGLTGLILCMKEKMREMKDMES